MSLRAKKKAAAAAAIRAAARQLFLQQGVPETRMEQIASSAGVSRATLFNYYPGKTALLDALTEEFEARLVKLLRHYRGKPVSAADALHELFNYAGSVLEQTSQLTRLLFVQGSEGAGFPALQSEFVALVERGQQQGCFRGDCPPGALAEPVYLAFVASLLDWCREPARGVSDQLNQRATILVTLLSAS